VHETATFLLVILRNIRRLSNKPLLIWLLTIPPNLKHAATPPCNLSLIACFLTLMFHKVVWQHMGGMLGLLVTSLLQIYQGIFQRKLFRRLVKISENLRPRVCDLTFLARPVCGRLGSRVVSVLDSGA